MSTVIRAGTPADFEALLDVWLRSVRATHTFLTEDDIQAMLPQVRDAALPALELWVACDGAGRPIGFAGLCDAKLEALFLAPECRRQGIGRALIEHARLLKGPLTVDVNEQNPEAVAFYAACGFRLIGRSETDGDGRPFPLLHMSE